MKRIWYNYKKWEDHKNGFYSTKKNDNEDDLEKKIKDMFEDDKKFFLTGVEVLNNWQYCTNYNLSHNASNRKSYLGQLCACYLFGASSKFTAKVWLKLDQEYKDKSNNVAQDIIDIYEKYFYDENNENIVRGKNEKLS